MQSPAPEPMNGQNGLRQPPIRRILRPFQKFMEIEAGAGILLILCAIFALIWANSPFAPIYDEIFHTHVRLDVGGFVLDYSLAHWINDGLMVIFFFVVGLEIKREILIGELSSPRQAALPIIAALGGMIVPALIYTAFNGGGPGVRGWGIPMATDIAFAIGVISLLGKRAPLALKVFLTAFAIVDDLGAVLVIAIFYTSNIVWGALFLGFGVLVLLLLLNRLGVQRPLPYAALGVVLWLAFLQSGVHATIAGVLLALTIPARARLNPDEFLAEGRGLLNAFEAAGHSQDGMSTEAHQAVVRNLEDFVMAAEAPMERLEHALQPWVAYLIMPIFAIANAGVALGGNILESLTHPVALGIIFGLVIGKQIGITLASFLAVRFGLAALPTGTNWAHIYGAGWLGGIGFTMSLFVSNLAFEGSNLLAEAKIGIFTASVIAGLVGFFLLRQISGPVRADEEEGLILSTGSRPAEPVGAKGH